jgi:uncharacterized protein YqcC (DUF446 family)
MAALLRELETALRHAGLWEFAPPQPAALESAQPFCVDTLELSQWLQWMFLPRMRALLDARAALPAECGIAAMAEMTYPGRHETSLLRVIEVLRAIDAAIAAS